ncbi:MAG TPA: hypothetical protein VHL58_01350 [Thermoanaerobaculia bacterium]|nr:hypothetical protein [Thermoanaerobaculia bacterium]
MRPVPVAIDSVLETAAEVPDAQLRVPTRYVRKIATPGSKLGIS